MNIRNMLTTLAAIVAMAGCVSTGVTRIDNMPMYGQPEIDRPAHLVKADEDFINSVVSGFGTRKEASKAWWAQGEKHMSQGNLDFAMRRYNQAWLLNPNNYQPYWGFARVQLEKGNVDDALKYFIKAESLIDDPRRKPALLSDMGSAYSVKGSTDSSYFAKANSKFAQSTKLDPKYPNSWRLWAFSLYEQGKYRDAWKKVEMAENLRARPFPRRFLSALSEKMPRP